MYTSLISFAAFEVQLRIELFSNQVQSILTPVFQLRRFDLSFRILTFSFVVCIFQSNAFSDIWLQIVPRKSGKNRQICLKYNF